MTQADIGIYGLGTMGSALALNLAEHGFDVAVSNLEPDRVTAFHAAAGPLAPRLHPAADLSAFVDAITPPRLILFMIPSGAPLDDMIARIRPLLAPGDTIIDAGNADFNDTRARAQDLTATGLHYVGMGVSGGATGARRGPSMMFGGSDHSWQRFRPMAEAIAAKFEGDPCVAHVGPDGAGHFVKTVHNGIEYADMQMIAEIYGLLRDGAEWPAPRIGALFSDWRTGPLASYLVDITAQVLGAKDPTTGQPLVDLIVDQAGQKGTGRWTAIEALKLGQSANTIEAAVGARAWSSDRAARRTGSKLLQGQATGALTPDAADLGAALLAGRILSHAQGFALMQAASQAFDWHLDLARIAEIWRAGCIIRSALLDDLTGALRRELPHQSLILDPALAETLATTIAALRRVVAGAVQAGLPVPALAGALSWYDTMRQARGTANLIQAQRDFFGAHGYRRFDAPDTVSGGWT